MKQGRWTKRLWLPALVLATVVFWLGCEQKGEMSPTSASRNVLTFIDTVIVDPVVVGPGGQAEIRARIRTERFQAAENEDVRFSVNRGVLNNLRPEVTVPSDATGWARATWTAPMDSGSVLLRTELISMDAMQTLHLRVRGAADGEGLMQLWSEADTLFADNGASTTRIYARLQNSANNPVGGATIYFSSSRGLITSPAITDSLTGTAMAVLTSTTEAGDAIIVARYGTVSDTIRIAFITPTSAGSIVVSAANSQLRAGTDSTQITAFVYDEDGLPIIDNTVVFFSTTAGTLRQLTARTRDGVAMTSLRAAPIVGEAVVSATTGGNVTGSATVWTIPGLAGIILLSSVEDTLPADNNSETVITATVTDAFSNPVVQGTTVHFTAEAGTVSETAIVGAGGIATAVFRAGPATGPASVTAEANSITSSLGLYLRPTIPASLTLTVNPLFLTANGTDNATLRAMVLDVQGRPVSDGTFVTFVSRLGVITASGSPAAVRGGAQRVKNTWDKGRAWDERTQPKVNEPRRMARGSFGRPTNSLYTVTTLDGYAEATLISTTQTALDTINALVSDLEEEQLVAYVPGPAFVVQVTAADESLPADGISATELTCVVTDAFGNPVSAGTPVSLAASLGTVTPAAAMTNTEGRVFATLYSARERGTAIVTVDADGAIGYGQVVFTTPDVAAVNLTSDVPAILGNGVATTTLTVTALDGQNLPVPGAPVSWSAEAGPGALINFTTLTDSAGQAQAVFRSGALRDDAAQQVTANVDDRSASRNVQMLGVTLHAWTGVEELPADGASTTPASILVRETTSGIAIAGANVRLAATLGSIPQLATTDNSGIATAPFRAGLEAGDAVITAYYGDTLRATASLRLASITADTLLVFMGEDELLADGVSSTPVTALVLTETGQPVMNLPVAFSTIGGGICLPLQVNTDENGVAVSTFYSEASNADVPVTVDVAIDRDSEQKAVMLRGVSVGVTATPASIIADGISTSLIRAHVYETTTFVAVAGVNVVFGSSLGTLPATAATNASGVAEVTLTSSTQTGTAAVSASFGSTLTAGTTVEFVPSLPTTLSITATPSSLPADNASTSAITVMVTDQGGSPVPNGTRIRFSVPPQGGSLESLRLTENGMATNTLIAGSTPGTIAVSAWAEDYPATRDSVAITYTVGDPAVLTLAAQQDTLNADGIAVDTITAHVTDAVGHPLPNVEVHFSANIGNIAASRMTNANGDARVAYSSSQTGTAQITATVGELSSVYTIYLIPGSPNSIALDYFPGSVGVRGSGRNETLLITATVRDANNNPVVDGTNVSFNIAGSPGGGDFLSTTGPVPTINGRATVSYNSGTVSGSVRVRAVCGGVSAVSTEILVYAGPPYIEDINLGCSTSHLSLAANPCNLFGMDVVGDSVVLVALIGDRYNNPVTPGTAVYFSTSGGVITTATGYTDSSGFARVTLFSGHPLPTVERWRKTLLDPNLGTEITCTATPSQPGMAKVMASAAGVDANGDSVTVWASTNVVFDYSQPLLQIRSASVNGDPTARELFIGENALINIAVHDPNFWPLVSGSTLTFTSSSGMIYPPQITVGCPSDTSFSVSFFNNLGLTDDDAASPVLINVDTRFGDTYAFTETFTLRAAFRP